ncbi:hypothetical protein BJG92_02751 [Arthrobacter sp. SO5]|nr:hypothetical protein [Arthrobacter sp. SO5]
MSAGALTADHDVGAAWLRFGADSENHETMVAATRLGPCIERT